MNALTLTLGLALAMALGASAGHAAPVGTAAPASPAAKTPAPAKASGAATKAPAGKPTAADADKDDKDKEDKEGPGSRTKKTREGSVLKSDTLLPGHVDLRSDAERKRDDELKTHFGRMAELDVIAAIASSEADAGLGEYVEQVRRKEVQRHQKVMIALKRSMAQASALAAGVQP